MRLEEKLEHTESPVRQSQPCLHDTHQANGKPRANGKAEVCEKQEANGKGDGLRKCLNLYTWQEIQRHNKETDQWLVIDRKVYNVTDWAGKHPGGRRVLNHYAGEDATDAFQAMHLHLSTVRLYLQPLLIGELSPEEPSQEKNKNCVQPKTFAEIMDDMSNIFKQYEARRVVMTTRMSVKLIEFSVGRLCSYWSYNCRKLAKLLKPQLVEDFRKLRKTLETMNMFSANLGFFFLHLAQIVVLEVLAWLILRHFGSGWTVTILISFLLTVSQAQSSFLQHDIGHNSMFKKSKWNQLMHKFVMCHLKGLSADWWNYRHFQHHVKPNIYPKDPDIDVGPLFLIGDTQPVKYGKKKIKYIDYEKQHLYFYMVALPLLMPVYFNLQSMQVMYLRKYWADIAWVSSFYIRYFITFGPFYGIFGTVLLIYLVKFMESPWIAYVTQMSHIPMKIGQDENHDWLSTQIVATCNIEQSFFNDWFTGHLNFQIEHHLFPTMPRHNYHKVAPLVKSLCAKHGLQYINKPILKAFGDIVRSLKKSAALWMEAYYE